MKRTKSKLVLVATVALSLFGVAALNASPIVYAAPATFVVTNTNDSGAGSLRQAIIDANSNSNPSEQDIISFNIASAGDVFIQPQTTLAITQSVLIDGYTQGDATANTAVWPQPFNGLLRVGIDNSVAGKMTVSANNTTIRGLVFSRSTDAEISTTSVSGLQIYGNYFDTTNNGLFGAKDENISAKTLELINTSNSQIGGAVPAQRNLFGYCANSCIDVSGSGSTNVAIKGNYVGVGADGALSQDTAIYSNYNIRTAAIKISDGADGVTIGGTGTGEGNSIEHNASGAILVQDSNAVSILGNRVLYNFWNNFWAYSGIVLEGATNTTVGSAGTGANTISGNSRDSLIIRNSTVTNNPSLDIQVQNNNFGVMSDQTTAFPNADGITVSGDSQDVLITDNRIKNATAQTGVNILENAQNISVLGNSIFNNEGIGINIDTNGVGTLTNTNDTHDTDTGPNEYLNSPGYTAITEGVSDTDVTYTADLPAGNYRIEFFSNTTADPSGVGEGETFIGYDEITSSGSGLQEFQHTLSGINHDNLALTATRIDPSATFGYGPTSEFGSVGEPFIPVADLSVVATLSNPEDILVGSTLNYQVTINNQGPDAINLTTLNSTNPGANNLFMAILPAYLAYNSVSGTNVACVDLGAGSAGGVSFGGLFADHSDHSVVTCGYTGGSSLLASGSSVTYQLSATVVSSGVGSATASFISPTLATDPDDASYDFFVSSGQDLITQLLSSGVDNFSQSSETAVVDLGVTKTLLNPEDVVLGGVLNYEIKLKNYGPTVLDMTRLNDPTPGQGTDLFNDILPPQLAYSGISGPNIACLDLGPGSATLFGSVLANHSDHSIVSCAHTASDILAVGDTVTYVLSATVVDDANLQFKNHILAESALGDPDAQKFGEIINNGDELIDELSNLQINNYDFAYSQKADVSTSLNLTNPQDVAPGATLTYDFAYTNNGPNSIDPTVFDSSGPNPFDTALAYFVLPPNLTYVSQSNSDLSCTWYGPGSASFTPFLVNHNDHSLLFCAYTGADNELGAGESIKSTMQFVTDSAPQSMTAYALGNTTIADKTDYNIIRNVYAFDGVHLIDILDLLRASQSNNFVLSAYTAPVAPGASGGTNAQNGGSNLATTGANAFVIVPAVLLVVSAAGIVIFVNRSSRYAVSRKKISPFTKKTILIVGVIAALSAGGLVVSLRTSKPKETSQPVSYDSAIEPEERLKNIPKDAKSEACDTIAVEKLTSAIGTELTNGRVSIPTAKTKEGSVSACMYIVKDRSKGGLDSLTLTQRKFTNEADGQKAFSLLTKISDNNRKMLSSTSFYNSNAKQIVSYKSGILTTVSFMTSEKTVSDKAIDAIKQILQS